MILNTHFYIYLILFDIYMEFLSYFDQLDSELRKKVKEAMDHIGIPFYQKRLDGSNLPVYPINQDHLLVKIEPLSSNPFLTFQAWHSLRIGLYSFLLINYLGIKSKEWRHNMFAAYLTHDYGKSMIMGTNDCFPINVNHKFGLDEKLAIKLHVALNVIGEVFNPTVTSIIERHHYYQKHNSYSRFPQTPETPEVKILAQILGIVDFYDAASSRINNRTQISTLDKILGNKFQSQRNIKKMLIDDYGDLQLSYNGENFPKVDKTGQEFIEEMYYHQILGRKNRLNPFK